MGSLGASAQAALPWGILHAPGIEKRIENGKGLPHGIEKKLDGDHDSGKHDGHDDDRLPAIDQLRVTGITQTEARISWTNSATSTGKVLVSDVRPIAEAQAKIFADATLATSHSVAVTGLTPDTTYFYLVQSTDASGNVSTSRTLSFKTAAQSDVAAPRILAVFAVNVTTNSARIVWVTDERADGKVWASTASPVLTAGTATQASADPVFFHEMTLTGLTPSTAYHYVVRSADASGNAAFSGEASFATAAQ